MKNPLTSVFQDTSAVDTLSASYGDQWAGAESADQAGAFITAMASNDLIFIVLAVSLIIWFVLLFYIIRTDKKVSRLEEELNKQSTNN